MHLSPISAMSEANNENNPHNWEAIVQEFTPALLEILSKTDEPVSYWLERFPKNTRIFLENIHINENLKRLFNLCLNFEFTPEEISKILTTIIVDKLGPDERNKRLTILRYFKSIIESKNKPKDCAIIEKHRKKLRDPDFVGTLDHSIIIDEMTGKTSLMLAIESEDYEIFNIFLYYYMEQNCLLGARDYKGNNALWYALQNGIAYAVEKICNTLQTKLQTKEPINTF